MTEQEIYDGVIMNGTTDFAFVVEALRRHGARWCVIGGLAVNAYAEPVYTAERVMVGTSNVSELKKPSPHGNGFLCKD